MLAAVRSLKIATLPGGKVVVQFRLGIHLTRISLILHLIKSADVLAAADLPPELKLKEDGISRLALQTESYQISPLTRRSGLRHLSKKTAKTKITNLPSLFKNMTFSER
jgi:hypothetical protein